MKFSEMPSQRCLVVSGAATPEQAARHVPGFDPAMTVLGNLTPDSEADKALRSYVFAVNFVSE